MTTASIPRDDDAVSSRPQQTQSVHVETVGTNDPQDPTQVTPTSSRSGQDSQSGNVQTERSAPRQTTQPAVDQRVEHAPTEQTTTNSSSPASTETRGREATKTRGSGLGSASLSPTTRKNTELNARGGQPVPNPVNTTRPRRRRKSRRGSFQSPAWGQSNATQEPIQAGATEIPENGADNLILLTAAEKDTTVSEQDFQEIFGDLEESAFGEEIAVHERMANDHIRDTMDRSFPTIDLSLIHI